MRIYAIGDIHGQLEKLRAAHALIAADRERTGDQTAPVVHLGDFIDRGPDSKGVIDHLIAGRERGAPWICLKGNHDRIFLGYLTTGDPTDHVLRKGLTWLDPPMGGLETLASYGVTKRFWTSDAALLEAARKAVPDAHLAFLQGLEARFETPEFFFCHAGIRPGVALDQQVEDDLVWIRSPFLEDTRDHGKIVVHGHTPVDTPEHYGNRIDLDTGAGFGRALTVAVFEGQACFVLGQEGRVPLLPCGG